MLFRSLAAVTLAIGLSAADPTTIAGSSGTIISGSDGVTIAGPSGTVISGTNGVETVIGTSGTVILSNGAVITQAPGSPSPATVTSSSGSQTASSNTHTGGVAPTAMADVYMMGAIMFAGAGALL